MEEKNIKTKYIQAYMYNITFNNYFFLSLNIKVSFKLLFFLLKKRKGGKLLFDGLSRSCYIISSFLSTLFLRGQVFCMYKTF